MSSLLRHQQVALEVLSWNPAAPGSVLLRLLGHDDRYVRRNVAQRKDLPPEVVDAILSHPDRGVRAAFAESWNADPAQRARLLDDPSATISLILAMGPNPYRMPVEPLPDWAYERLLAHPRDSVRHETAASASVPAHVRAGMAGHPESFFRRMACRAWDQLDDSARESLLNDEDSEVRQAAALRVCHDDEERTAWLVEALAESWQLHNLLAVGRLGRGLAERLMAKGDRLSSLAANPSLPADLVARLAVSPDPYVRLVVSARPELTEDERAAIEYTVGPEDRLDTLTWVWEAREDMDVLRRCATSAHLWLRWSAAACPELPQDLVELLARDEDFAVRLLLCEFHPEPPPELLLALFLNGGHRAVGMLAAKPRFPAEGLAARFADSSDPKLRLLALRDPGLGAEDLDRLSRDPQTRAAAARDPRLPLSRIRELLADTTTGSVAGNPALPVEAMHAILDGAGVPRAV
ncbi:hypothetical protein ACFWOJ_28455 [Streptomyces sp. NPDC058439]|uniref:hypothetical protein n=1 Tax=Streptomyces sp. NPDC058439 TaxID=3346500 RepID=UPI003663C62C